MTFSLPMADLTRHCVQASLKGVPVDQGIKKTAMQSLEVLLEPANPAEKMAPYTPYSRLTPTGFPVEVAFGNPANALRFATEIGGSSPASSARLTLGAERFHTLGHVVDPEMLEWCQDLQRGQPLKYGAWASLRVSDTAQNFKLYVEVPLASHAKAMQEFTAPGNLGALLTERGARLTMVGLPDDDEVEFYFGLNGMRLDELPSLYEKLDMPGGGQAVIKALETVCGRYLNRAISSRQNGLSFKKTISGDWLMTLFCQADDLFSSGAQTREALLKAAPILGCDLSDYEAFSRSVVEEVCENRHCMLAFTPLPNGEVDLRVGLSPTPPKEASFDVLEGTVPSIASEQPNYYEPQVIKPVIPDHISRTLFQF